MAKAYINDIGTAVKLNTFIDLTPASTVEILVKKPNGDEVVWAADFPEDLTAADGIIEHISEAGDFDQAGTYKLQAHIETASSDHRGNTAKFEVFDEFQ